MSVGAYGHANAVEDNGPEHGEEVLPLPVDKQALQHRDNKTCGVFNSQCAPEGVELTTSVCECCGAPAGDAPSGVSVPVGLQHGTDLEKDVTLCCKCMAMLLQQFVSGLTLSDGRAWLAAVVSGRWSGRVG